MSTTIAQLKFRRRGQVGTHDGSLDAPLDQLLAAHDVELVETAGTYPGFVGILLDGVAGRRVLALPAGRSAPERDAAVRRLLGEATNPLTLACP
jgi:hypothetical protein